MSELGKYFINLFNSVSIIDLIDVVIISILFYYVFKFIRDRRAGKLAVGVVFLIVAQIVGEYFNLKALNFLLQNIFQVGVIAIIVLFQPEFRSMLEKVGGEPLKGIKNIAEQKDNAEMSELVDSICEAVCDMSLDKTGAIIVLEQETKLGDYVKNGTVIDAEVSPRLLKSVFYDKAPLHDGAVIIRDGRLYAAGCFLPLSNNPDIIKDLGTRHRAAIGISENCDAFTIVVSEETGVISVAHDGHLSRNYDYKKLHKLLMDVLAQEIPNKKYSLKKGFWIKEPAKKNTSNEKNG